MTTPAPAPGSPAPGSPAPGSPASGSNAPGPGSDAPAPGTSPGNHPEADPRPRQPLGLFDAYGIEMEYMIVDRDTLDVCPICDALFHAAAREHGCETTGDVEPTMTGVDDGLIAWSNELALHVVELKTARPAPAPGSGSESVPDFAYLVEAFQANVERINALLAPMNAMLLPSAMHPWMDPDTQTKLWPHECNEIYRAYDRIFSCQGHGWGNLQSTHLNLPYANDEEFAKLHAALRVLLPLLPALAASSPFVDGQRSTNACHRMAVYRTNSARIPLMTGLVVPDPVHTQAEFQANVLDRLYAQLAPLDPDGVLKHPFANARGAMVRPDRMAIEIRVLDLQECPRADLTVARFAVAIAQALCQQRWAPIDALNQIATDDLHQLLRQTTQHAEHARIQHPGFMKALGFNAADSPSNEHPRAADVLAHLQQTLLPDDPTLAQLLAAGSLSTRLTRALPDPQDPAARINTYRELAHCLQQGQLFRAF